MDPKQRLSLDKMIQGYKEDGYTETTGKIRKLKHSVLISNDVRKLMLFKQKYKRLSKTNFEQYKAMARTHCKFLYNNYTDIFNKLLKEQLNLQILAKFLSVLKRIEDGNIDQHEGSYEVGALLKKLYIDSVLIQDKQHAAREKRKGKKSKPKRPVHNISWKRFKELGIN